MQTKGIGCKAKCALSCLGVPICILICIHEECGWKYAAVVASLSSNLCCIQYYNFTQTHNREQNKTETN